MKRWIALTLVFLLLTATLCGCGMASKNEADIEYGGAIAEDSLGRVPDKNGITDSASGSTVSTPEIPMNQKLVRKLWLNAETDDLDTLLQQVDEKIAQLGGYAQNRNVYHGSGKSFRTRTASLTIRIPVAQLDQFVSHVTELSNITSSNETADDITLTYVATQSRVTALQTEHDRLLELLAKAENMSDLLQIEKRLTEVRAELEEVTSKLKLYDNMVDYGTIYLELSEVKEYTDVTEPETVWQRIGKGFMKSLAGLGKFFTELFVFIIVGLPYFAVIAVVITAVVLIIKLRRKKSKEKKDS